jgi:hypothetical protein
MTSTQADRRAADGAVAFDGILGAFAPRSLGACARTGSWRRIAVHVLVGAWLSLVEHSVRDRGVGGSNPLAPTSFLNFLKKIRRT